MSFVAGLVLLLWAAVMEADTLWLHLTQHVVLWDVAPILLLVGARRLPPGFPRALANPAVALPLWLASLAFWHVPAVFDAALRHDLLHLLGHAELFLAGLAMWAPLLGAVPAPAWFGVGWRFGYVATMQLAGLVFANVLLWTASPLYAQGTLTDQRVAGGVVLLEGSLVAIGLFAWLFLRYAALETRRSEYAPAGPGSR